MKVILLEDVRGVGAAGAVANVADGHAHNLLFPRKLAIPANAANMKNLERQREIIRRRQVQEAKTAETKAEKISGLSLTMKMKSGEGGRLYGAVTNASIADALAEQGVEIDRRTISLPFPIKTIGSHEAKVHLHKDIEAIVKIEVVSDESAV